MKQTEDEIIKSLTYYLIQNGWTIESYALGAKRGNDIEASKDNTILIIEAKGAKASDDAPTKKREKFDSGQIKTHFGKAIVKILDEKYLNPKAKFGIAHPDDTDIKRSIGHLTPFLKTMGIKHFWVSSNGTVIEE
jgi:hypothetical protein